MVVNNYHQTRKVPGDWKKACIVPFYKGKGGKYKCKNYRGISLANIPGKVYGRIVIQMVLNETEDMKKEEKRSFQHDRGCVAQISVLRQPSVMVCQGKVTVPVLCKYGGSV